MYKLVFRNDYRNDLGKTTSLFATMDSSHATAPDGKSVSAFCVYLYGCLIYSYSKKQTCVALNSCEAEFIAASDCAKQLAFIVRVCRGFGLVIPDPTPMLEDNQAATYLSEKATLNNPRTRHMNVRYHWLLERVQGGEFKLWYVDTENQVADVITKNAKSHVHKRLVPLLLGHQPILNDAIKKALVAATTPKPWSPYRIEKPEQTMGGATF